MRSNALRADLLMLVTAMIWGSSFVAQRLGMDSIGPFLYSGLRFALAALILLPVLRLLEGRISSAKVVPLNRQLLRGGMLMGLALALGINLQQVGLLFTSVTNSGFITGLYVIIVPLLGLFIGHKTGLGIWLGACMAVVGMFLLSVGEGFQVASGDWLQLAGAFVWGVHVLLVGFFAGRHDPLRLALVQFITCAVISLVLAVIFEENPAASDHRGPARRFSTAEFLAWRSALPCRWWRRKMPSPPTPRSSSRWKRYSPPLPALGYWVNRWNCAATSVVR